MHQQSTEYIKETVYQWYLEWLYKYERLHYKRSDVGIKKDDDGKPFYDWVFTRIGKKSFAGFLNRLWAGIHGYSAECWSDCHFLLSPISLSVVLVGRKMFFEKYKAKDVFDALKVHLDMVMEDEELLSAWTCNNFETQHLFY